MKVNDFVRVKSRDMYGIVVIPSKEKTFGLLKYKTLNLVLLEDNTKICCRDDDLEIIKATKEE